MEVDGNTCRETGARIGMRMRLDVRRNFVALYPNRLSFMGSPAGERMW